MARLLPLTNDTELAVLEELKRLVIAIGPLGVGERLVSLLWQSEPACKSLAERPNKLLDTIGFMSRRDLLAQYVPVVTGSIVPFSTQCANLSCVLRCPFFDDEIGCTGGRDDSFVIRKFPHVAFRSLQPARLGHLMQRVQRENVVANATVWDVLADIRSCRERLPHKCAIGTLHSRICSKHGAKDPIPLPRTHMVFFLCGRKLEIRNVSENEVLRAPFLLLNYADSTLGLPT